jgi:hypothetical protein
MSEVERFKNSMNKKEATDNLTPTTWVRTGP